MTRPHLASALMSTAWARAAMVVCALALFIMLALFHESEGDARIALAETPPPRPSCGLWDDQATAAIAHRVRESTRDDELRLLADAIFRLRRARRNCAEGWVGIACRDYHAIMRSVSGPSGARPLFVALPVCGGDLPAIPSEARTLR